jgi:HK97 gp10 family phage protein
MVEVVKFTGGKELEAALRDLPKATARNALQRALKKAAEPVAADWKAKAPRDQGHLERSIIVGPSSKLTSRQKKDAKKEGTYFAEIHVGTADPAGQQQEFGNVNHPAQPSGRPAWDGNKQSALDGIAKDMWAEIEKAAARRNKKLGL